MKLLAAFCGRRIGWLAARDLSHWREMRGLERRFAQKAVDVIGVKIPHRRLHYCILLAWDNNASLVLESMEFLVFYLSMAC